MGCILYELAMTRRAFESDWDTQEYKRRGESIDVSLDDTFSEQCKSGIVRNIYLMLQIDHALRPVATYFLEEFSRNYESANSLQHQDETRSTQVVHFHPGDEFEGNLICKPPSKHARVQTNLDRG
jgi:hypothetical protein